MSAHLPHAQTPRVNDHTIGCMSMNVHLLHSIYETVNEHCLKHFNDWLIVW